MNAHEAARQRVMKRLAQNGGMLSGSTWLGLGWKFDDNDRQTILMACNTLAGAVADLRAEVAKIKNTTKASPYVNQLNAIDRDIAAKRTTVSGAGYTTKEAFDQALIYLNTAAPKALSVMRPLVIADQQDPTGATAEKMMTNQIAAIDKQQAEIMSSWYMDPQAFIENEIAAAGKAASGTVLGIQWAMIKGLWPLLLVGGGIAALWFFGPALGVVAKRMAGRIPGELPPGTTHQPGE